MNTPEVHRYHRRPSYAPGPGSPRYQGEASPWSSHRPRRYSDHFGLRMRLIIYSLVVFSIILLFQYYVSFETAYQLEHSSTFRLPHGVKHKRHSKSHRPRAALISLVRNSELAGIQQSIRQLEHQFNSNSSHQYPWIFFNDEPFDDEFISGTINLTSAGAYYEVIPSNHWEIPRWISKSRFLSSLEYLGSIGVGKGWLVSYSRVRLPLL